VDVMLVKHQPWFDARKNAYSHWADKHNWTRHPEVLMSLNSMISAQTSHSYAKQPTTQFPEGYKEWNVQFGEQIWLQLILQASPHLYYQSFQDQRFELSWNGVNYRLQLSISHIRSTPPRIEMMGVVSQPHDDTLHLHPFKFTLVAHPTATTSMSM